MSRCESYMLTFAQIWKKKKKDGSSFENQETDIPPLFLPLVLPDHKRPQSLLELRMFWKEYNCNHMNQQSSLSWICITVYLCVTVYASAVSKRLHLFCQCKISLNNFLLFPSWPHGALALFKILQMTSLCNKNVIMGCYRSLHIF